LLALVSDVGSPVEPWLSPGLFSSPEPVKSIFMTCGQAGEGGVHSDQAGEPLTAHGRRERVHRLRALICICTPLICICTARIVNTPTALQLQCTRRTASNIYGQEKQAPAFAKATHCGMTASSRGFGAPALAALNGSRHVVRSRRVIVVVLVVSCW
jgi:hypothetical protein